MLFLSSYVLCIHADIWYIIILIYEDDIFKALYLKILCIYTEYVNELYVSIYDKRCVICKVLLYISLYQQLSVSKTHDSAR